MVGINTGAEERLLETSCKAGAVRARWQCGWLGWSYGDEKAKGTLGIEVASVSSCVGIGLAQYPQSPGPDTP